MSTRSLLRDREFAALSASAFARAQAYSTILIALALYADLFDTTGTVEGLFGTAFAVVQLLIVLPLGRAIDVGNAKRFLLGGLLLNVAVFVGFAFVESAVHVILIRLVQGVGASVLWVTGAAVVGEISPQDARGFWLGSYNQVGAVSSLAGDLLGGYLLYAHGFVLTYAALSGVTLLAFVLVWLSLRDDPGGQADPEDATGVETIRALLDRPTVWSLVVFRVAFSVGKMAVIIFLPIYARKGFGVSPLAIGAILAGGKLMKALLQGWMGELTDRLGHRHRFVAVGALLYAVGTAAIPLAGLARDLPALTVRVGGLGGTVGAPILVLFGAYGLLGVADSVRLPASMAMFVEAGEPDDAVAASMSLRSVSWKLGQVAGPVFVGAVKDLYSTRTAFLTAAGFIVLATAAFLWLHARGSSMPGAAPAGGD